MEDKDLSKGLLALTVGSEREEILAALNGKEANTMPKLKREKPQKDYKLVNDSPVCVGYLEMYTIESDFMDKLGRNRKGSTFGLLGLQELGINPVNCEVTL